MGEMGNAYKILVGKPDEKRPVEGPMHRWEDNIRTNFTETVRGCGMDISGSE
jgi:hypothetical protein